MIQGMVGRLIRVERENRRLKRVGALALLALAVVVLMGQAASPSKVVRAQLFALRDTTGKDRATLSLGTDGSPALTFLDQDAKPRLTLFTIPDGSPAVGLLDKDGKPIWGAR
jgi:hypothetical protein